MTPFSSHQSQTIYRVCIYPQKLPTSRAFSIFPLPQTGGFYRPPSYGHTLVNKSSFGFNSRKNCKEKPKESA